MKNWKFTDNTNRVVFFENESCLVSADEIKAWIAAGNTPTPADPTPEPTYQDLRKVAYLPMSDYLDAVVKGDTVQQQIYIDDCLAVKARYPKP